MSEFLAFVEYAHAPRDDEPALWCRLTPICRSDKGSWNPVEDRSAAFPPRGQIFWFKPDRVAEALTLWRVTIKENEGAAADYDKWIVETARTVSEFWSPDIRDPVELRRAIADGSLSLHRRPLGPVYVQLPWTEDEWIGPVEFTLRDDGRWYAVRAAVGFVNVVHIDDAELIGVTVGPNRVRALPPEMRMPPVRGSWNVQDDETLLRSLQRSASRQASDDGEAMRITQERWRQYAARVAALGANASPQEAARRDAIRQLLQRTEEAIANEVLLVDAALEHPTVRAQLDEAVRRRAADVEQEIRLGIEERLTALRQEIEDRQGRLDTLEATISENQELVGLVQAELDELQGRRETLSATVAEELRELVTAMVRDPIGELMRETLVRGMITAIPHDGRRVSRRSGEERLLSIDAPADPTPEVGADAVAGELRVFAGGLDLDPRSAMALLAAASAGRMALLYGRHSLALGGALGRTTSGRETWYVHVPTTIFGLDDLLSCTAIQATGASSEAVCLGDVLTVATAALHWVTIVLVDVNRAPPELVLSDLIAASELNSTEPSLPWYDKTSGLRRRVPLSRSVRWVGTLSTGKTCFRITPELRRKLALIDCDRAGPIQGSVLLPESVPQAGRLPISEFGDAPNEELPAAGLAVSTRREMLRELSAYSAVFPTLPDAWAAWVQNRLTGDLPDESVWALASAAGQPFRDALSNMVSSESLARMRRYLEETA